MAKDTNPYGKAKKGESDSQRKQRQVKYYKAQRIHAEETGDQATTNKIYGKLGKRAPNVDADQINKAILGAIPMIAMGVAGILRGGAGAGMVGQRPGAAGPMGGPPMVRPGMGGPPMQAPPPIARPIPGSGGPMPVRPGVMPGSGSPQGAMPPSGMARPGLTGGAPPPQLGGGVVPRPLGAAPVPRALPAPRPAPVPRSNRGTVSSSKPKTRSAKPNSRASKAQDTYKAKPKDTSIRKQPKTKAVTTKKKAAGK